MAYPGFRASPDHRPYNAIAHDKYGIPNSPLYGVSPRRPQEHTPAQRENIEAIRDQEIKLMRGSIKPEMKPKAGNTSSYDLISGVQNRKMTSDSEFDRIRDREMIRQGRNPHATEDPSPREPSPIKTDRGRVPASPLYRPGQTHRAQVQDDHTYVQNQQDRSPRDNQSPHAGGHTFHGDRNYTPHVDQEPQSRLVTPRENFNQYSPQPVGHFRPGVDSSHGRHDAPRYTPVYRPGEGKGLMMADPRTGTPIRGGKPWQDTTARPAYPPTPDYNTTKLNLVQNEDDDTKVRMSNMNVRDSRDNFNALGEFRDHRGNFVIRGFPVGSYRSGYGLSSDRGNLRRNQNGDEHDQSRNNIEDPRHGGPASYEPAMGNRNGGALLFIKFSNDRGDIQVAGHAFLRAKTRDTGGRYLGMASQVVDFGYEQGPNEAIAVFHFPSMEKALIFFQTDNVLKQPDFPPPYGHAEMWMVCNAYLPDNMKLFNTFLLSDIQLHAGKDRREFFESFQVPFENYLYKNGAMPFVVCSYGPKDRQDIRRHCYHHNSIVSCHLFQGIEHLNWITNDETYSKFRSLHNQMATEKCSVFRLSRDTGL